MSPDLAPEPKRRDEPAALPPAPKPLTRTVRFVLILSPVLLLLLIAAYFVSRHYVRKDMAEALPQLDGSVYVPRAGAPFFGLAAPVTVDRDARGVPHIHAGSLDDLVFAQGYVTAQDRLWQMELLRRHAAGELAAVLGPSMLEHDRVQRTLQLRASADRAIAVLPADQRHFLEMYARGVNTYMLQTAEHLPLEFRLLRYKPAPWQPRDSLLIAVLMSQDLSTSFPQKLAREALSAKLPPDLVADLYPVGSWRDHAPDQPLPDLTSPKPEYEDIPLDESQSRLGPEGHPGASGPAFETWARATADLLSIQRTLALFHAPCSACVAGSNAWAVAGSRTASGKPILSNDMHLTLSVPELWYEADLDATLPAPLADFHVAGVTIPGTPFVIAGHNAHVAWGLTNLGADVQDIYIEHTRGTPSGAEYQSADGSWHRMMYHREVIHIRNAADVTLDVPLIRHGEAELPVISGLYPSEKRTLSLRWTVYDPANITDPFLAVDSASDWTTMLAAFQSFGGPAQNLVYADDQGHIGYHAIGRIPLRGDAAAPTAIPPGPVDATASDAPTHAWVGYIPFDRLPQAFDPADGVLATANARVTPDGYAFPVTLNWMAPYRTERIYKVLEAAHGFTPADSLALQGDVVSTLDQLLAQRIAYAIDNTTGPLKADKTLHQAADLLRNWNGSVDASSPAAAIVDAARRVFWPVLLLPRVKADAALAPATKPDPNSDNAIDQLYAWGERDAVEEQLVMHTPARWLPPGIANWNDLLAAICDRGLREAHAPHDLSTWSKGKAYPIDLEHPIFGRSDLVKNLIGIPVGTGPQPVSGDADTVRQIHGGLAPSERFTADLADPDRTTLNLALGQSGNLSSPWFLDQFDDWLHARTYPLPFTPAASQPGIAHSLTLRPQ